MIATVFTDASAIYTADHSKVIGGAGAFELLAGPHRDRRPVVVPERYWACPYSELYTIWAALDRAYHLPERPTHVVVWTDSKSSVEALQRVTERKPRTEFERLAANVLAWAAIKGLPFKLRRLRGHGDGSTSFSRVNNVVDRIARSAAKRTAYAALAGAPA